MNAVSTGVMTAVAAVAVLLLGACGQGDGSGDRPLSSPAATAPAAEEHAGMGQATLDRVRAALARTDGALAGVYLTGSGRVVHVLVARDVKRYRLELPKLAEPGVTVEVDAARYPLAELERVLDEISDGQAALRKDGIPVVAAGVDERRNRVLVTLEKRTAEAERTLRERFGDTLAFEEGTAATT